MLIIKGDFVLIGCSSGWLEGMYLFLVGFVESGEMFEVVVCCEVLEEVGIVVGCVDYFGF